MATEQMKLHYARGGMKAPIVREVEAARLKLHREPPADSEVVGEAVLATLVVLLLVGGAVLWAMIGVRDWRSQTYLSPEDWLAPILLPIGALIGLWLILRDWWCNAGVVTEIVVTKEQFWWRQSTVWGPREVMWDARSITRVAVGPDWLGRRMIKVHRLRGATLKAFRGQRRAELVEVAAVIRNALPAKSTAAANRSASVRV